MSYELRPLTLAEILDAAFRLVQKEWRTLVGLSMLMQIPIVIIASQASWLFDPFAEPFGASGEPTPEMLLEMGLSGGGMMLAYLVLYPLVAGSVTASVGNFYLGRRFSLSEATRAGFSAIVKLVLSYFVYVVAIVVVGLLAGMIIGGGSALIAPSLDALGTAGTAITIVAAVALVGLGFFWGFFAMTASALLAPVVILESRGIFGSVSRIFALGSTAKWRLIGVVLTGGLIVSFPVFGAQTMIGFVPYLGVLIWALFQAVGFAFTTSVAVVLYFDLRCRAENYDLELLAEQVEAGPGLGQ